MKIKYGNTTRRNVPSYVVKLQIAAEVLAGCAIHDNSQDTRAAARFTIREARYYIDEAEKLLGQLDKGDS